MLSLFGIILGLALLIFLAFRGKSLLWAAPICALVVALTGGLDLDVYKRQGQRRAYSLASA